MYMHYTFYYKYGKIATNVVSQSPRISAGCWMAEYMVHIYPLTTTDYGVDDYFFP